MVHGHELGDACLGEALEGDLFVGEPLGHLVVDGPVHRHCVVHPEDLPVHGLNGGVRGDSVSEHLREVFLIHARDVVETGTVLVDVRSDARALGGDVRMVLHHEEVSGLQLIGVSCGLEVPDVRARDEVLGVHSQNGDSHRQQEGLERHIGLVGRGL